VQEQAEACGYRTAEGGGSTFSWFWVFLWNMIGSFPSSGLGTLFFAQALLGHLNPACKAELCANMGSQAELGNQKQGLGTARRNPYK